MPQVHTVTLNAGMLSGGSHQLWYSNADASFYQPPPVNDPGVRPSGVDDRPKHPCDPPPPRRKRNSGGEGSDRGSTGPTGKPGGGRGQKSGVTPSGSGDKGGGGGSNSGPGGGGGKKNPPGSSGPVEASPGTGNVPVGGKISRKDILERAKYWAQKGIAYSMSSYTNDPQGKSYRTDCSGLVSMALKLDNSLSTVSLPSQVDRIDKNDLKPGVIVGNLGSGTAGASGHVMVFNGWVDDSKTSFYTIEETPPRAVERTREWGGKYTSGAWRYKNVAD